MTDLTTLQKQAARGNAQAQVQLAFLLLVGRGVTPSFPAALDLLRAACAQGSANGMMLHAALAARGLGRAKSLDDAYALIQQAAGLGHQHARAQLKLLGTQTLDREPWTKPVNLHPLADAPRVFTVEGLLTAPVCKWLMKAATGKLRPSTVFDPSGGVMLDPARNNTAAALSLIEGDLIQQLVCRRIAIATGMPLVHHEPMNILHYDVGQEYKPHYDFIRPGTAEAQGYAHEIAQIGQRAVTVLVYLNEGYEGGETVFPRLGLRFKGKPGDALIFWNVSQTGEVERNSMHGGAPVTRGEKWLLSQWIREKPIPLT